MWRGCDFAVLNQVEQAKKNDGGGVISTAMGGTAGTFCLYSNFLAHDPGLFFT